jgi:thiol-disulfide isomerase/thioredoxin
MRKVIFILLIGLLSFGCTRKNKESNNSNRVVISYVGDSLIVDYIWLHKINPKCGYQTGVDSSLSIKDGCSWSFELREPSLLRFFRKTRTVEICEYLYVNPGDSIVYILEPKCTYNIWGVDETAYKCVFYNNDTLSDKYKAYRMAESYNCRIVKYISEGRINMVDSLIYNPLSQSYYHALNMLNKKSLSIKRDTLEYHVGSEIKAEILANTYLLDFLSGDTITMKKVLDQLKGNVIYFDIWSSWCNPCKYAIRNSAEIRQYLDSIQNVEILYLSIDKNIEDWKTVINEESGFQRGNQYLLIDGFNSPVGLLFKECYVPQYFVLDSKNQIVTMKAPRLTDSYQKEVKLLLEGIIIK